MVFKMTIHTKFLILKRRESALFNITAISYVIFPVQILVNFNIKIFNKLRGTKFLSSKFNFNFSVKLFSLMFKNYWLGFFHI